jgi:hypothetical protein
MSGKSIAIFHGVKEGQKTARKMKAELLKKRGKAKERGARGRLTQLKKRAISDKLSSKFALFQMKLDEQPLITEGQEEVGGKELESGEERGEEATGGWPEAARTEVSGTGGEKKQENQKDSEVQFRGVFDKDAEKTFCYRQIEAVEYIYQQCIQTQKHRDQLLAENALLKDKLARRFSRSEEQAEKEATARAAEQLAFEELEKGFRSMLGKLQTRCEKLEAEISSGQGLIRA